MNIKFRNGCLRAVGILAFTSLTFALPSAARAQWTIINLHASGTSGSAALKVGDSTQIGWAVVSGAYHAGRWSGTAATWIDLNPAGSGESVAWGGGAQQAGYASFGGVHHAGTWNGTAGSWNDLHPFGSSRSTAADTDGVNQVGFAQIGGYFHASIWSGTASSWVDLSPGGAHSEALGVYAGQQVGYVISGGQHRASLWSGSAVSWLDLTPTGASYSNATCIDGTYQGGEAIIGGVRVAGYWSGTATSWVNLHPIGSNYSRLRSISGSYQVGESGTPGSSHASLWHGTAASWVDLHSFLPSGFTYSFANGIWVDGGTIYVVGDGYNSNIGRNEAVMWVLPNQPPSANAGPDQTVDSTGPGGTSVILDGSGSTDPNNDTLTYSWSGPFGTVTGISPTVTLPVGVHTITLTVADATSSNTDIVVIIVLNDPPIANAGPDQTIHSTGPGGTSVTLDGSGSSDSNNDTLTYSWSGPFGTVTGISPTVTLQVGIHAITLTVSDGDSQATDIVQITILNDLPVANAGPDQSVHSTGPGGTSVTLDGTGSSDPNNDTLTYSWSDPFGTASGVNSVVSLPVGVHTVTLTVADGRTQSSDTVQITVLNDPPVANAGPDQSIYNSGPGGTFVALSGSGSSDPNNDTLTYSWSGSFGSATGMSPIVVLPIGVHTITLIVNDGIAESTDTVLITVLNNPPVANAGPDQMVHCTSRTGAGVVLNGSGSSDQDMDGLTYSWSGTFGTVTGVSPTVQLPFGMSTIVLTVSDGQFSSTDTVQILVTVDVDGFLTPMAALVPLISPTTPAPSHAMKRGRTIPLKLRLLCGTTLLSDCDVSAPEIVAIFRVGEAEILPIIDPDSGAANDNGCLFRFAGDKWIFNLSTQWAQIGNYEIRVRMPDGQIYKSRFDLR